MRELAREIVLNMVYFDSWDEFAAAVEQLCVAEPRKVSNVLCAAKIGIQFINSLYNTCLIQFADVLQNFKVMFLSVNCLFQFRFVVKYRHCDGKLVLKGTDDQVVTIDKLVMLSL